MGFHLCTFCKPDAQNRFSNISSGDVTLVFASGRSWEMPDMILHYVADHNWHPPGEFIRDVMNSQLIGGSRLQTKGLVVRIGYLVVLNSSELGSVPNGFIDRLKECMRLADEIGQRIQTRGAVGEGQ